MSTGVGVPLEVDSDCGGGGGELNVAPRSVGRLAGDDEAGGAYAILDRVFT